MKHTQTCTLQTEEHHHNRGTTDSFRHSQT